MGLYVNDPDGFLDRVSRDQYWSTKGDEKIGMSMSLYKGDELLYTLPYDDYWWINGFKLAIKDIDPSELTLKANLNFDDRTSKNAFISAYASEYGGDGISYENNDWNNQVSIVWR